jgi:alginate O-acetyltransferase complex protein AlgJ
MTARPVSKFEAILLSVLFVGAICLPGARQIILGHDPDMVLVEYRDPTPFPAFSFKHLKFLKQFPQEFEAYYNDNFGFRPALLRFASAIKVHVFGVSAARTVIIGKNRWLFLKDDYTYKKSTRLTEEDMQHWTQKYEERRAWLADRGIKYIYMLAPNKQSVYPELMPPTFNHTEIEPPQDQLTAWLAAHSTFRLFPLRDTLVDARRDNKNLLYYPEDTHWNSVGAYAGYRAVVLEMQKWYPDLKPLDPSYFRVETQEKHGDLARMTGVPNYVGMEPEMLPVSPAGLKQTSFKLPGIDHPVGTEPFTTENPNAPSKLNVLILRDSFGTSFVPFFSEQFAKVTSIWSTQGNKEFEQALAKFVEEDKPDVFIEERTERVLLGQAPLPGTQFDLKQQ